MTAQGPRATYDSTPTVRIRPHRGWASLNLRELWSYRELLYFFVWRDLKVRYKQTAVGALWAVIQPFLLMVVFTLFLGRINGIAPEGIPYPLFAYAGLVPWTLFASSLIGSSGSLVDAANLLQKVYFPRLLLPAAAIGSFLLDFAIAMVVLLLLMLYFGYPPTQEMVWLAPLTLLAVATAAAVGVWLSAVNVRYRDVRYAVPFLVQLWLFASPVAYTAALVPAEWQPMYRLNPMVGVIEGFRWALLGEGAPPPIEAVLVSVLVTAVVLAAGLAYFRRVERTFADVI
jgi:homopolymeric O-antigen transport system permease protein